MSLVPENLNDELLVGRIPSPHHSIRINNGLDIVLNILHLSALVMQGNEAESQRIEDGLDVCLGSTGDANV